MKTFHCYILTISLLAFACRNEVPIKETGPEYRVRVARVATAMISLPVHSTGILSSSEELKLSFKTGGIIASVDVKEGDRVKKGDLLAALDPSEIKANVEQAESGYDKALRDLSRVENLYRDSVVTLEQKQNATTALNVAKSTLEIARFNFAHSRITAPENGIVLKQLARQNELVAAGYPVFLFGSTGKQWKVRSGLADKDIVKVNPGDSAIVSFDAYPDVKFPAVVDLTGRMADPYTGTYETELLLDASGYRLASGFIASVDIFPVNKQSYLTIPVSSVVDADGQQGYVYVLTDSATVQKVRVDIVNVIGSMAAVKGLPGPAAEIVSEGAAYLRDGVKVNVIRE